MSGKLHHQSRRQGCGEVRRATGTGWRAEAVDRSGYCELRKIAAVIPASTLAALDQLLGPRGYLHRPEDLTLYEYDGGVDKARPDLVVFPQSTEAVAATVRIANHHGLPTACPAPPPSLTAVPLPP